MLVQALRRTALAGTELAEAQVGTIRLKLLKVAARVVVTVRRVVFHLASSYPYRGLFERVCRAVAGRTPSRRQGRAESAGSVIGGGLPAWGSGGRCVR